MQICTKSQLFYFSKSRRITQSSFRQRCVKQLSAHRISAWPPKQVTNGYTLLCFRLTRTFCISDANHGSLRRSTKRFRNPLRRISQPILPRKIFFCGTISLMGRQTRRTMAASIWVFLVFRRGCGTDLLGTLKFPPEYPFKPPAVTMITPSGILPMSYFLQFYIILISKDAFKLIHVSASRSLTFIPRNGILHGKSLPSSLASSHLWYRLPPFIKTDFLISRQVMQIPLGVWQPHRLNESSTPPNHVNGTAPNTTNSPSNSPSSTPPT